MLYHTPSSPTSTSSTSCSSTTRTRKVRFDPKVEIIIIDTHSSYTSMERSNSWYTVGECRSFKKAQELEETAIHRSAMIGLDDSHHYYQRHQRNSQRIDAALEILRQAQEYQTTTNTTTTASPLEIGSSTSGTSTANQRWSVEETRPPLRRRNTLPQCLCKPLRRQSQEDLPGRWSTKSTTTPTKQDLSPFMPMRHINTPPMLLCALR